MKPTSRINRPVTYKGCIIAPAPTDKGGFDVFEPSGRWFYVPTQRQAKWWAAVRCTLEGRLTSNPARPVPTVPNPTQPNP